MIRTYQPHIHNRIANDRSVYGFVAPDPFGEPLDFIEMADRPEHYWLFHNGHHDLDFAADAGVIFEWSAPDVFELHTMFLPSCRGRKALAEARNVVGEMFASGAQIIWGQTPLGNRPARWFNRQLGAESKGQGHHYLFGPVELFSCSKARWNDLPR